MHGMIGNTHEPISKAGIAKLLGVPYGRLTTWEIRTRKGEATPVLVPEPRWTDESGQRMWDRGEIEDWWADHPKNPANAGSV